MEKGRKKLSRILVFAILVSFLIGLSVFKNFDLRVSTTPKPQNFWLSDYGERRKDRKYAYVFYVTSSDYVCYALINAHRLIFDFYSDPKIDIVILFTDFSRIGRFCPDSKCPFLDERVKMRRILPSVSRLGQKLTSNMYYKDSYVRFEAFGLYDEYDRLVVLDSDGFIMKNIDHLFQIDLGRYRVAAALAHYLTRDWISSVLLVVEPSKKFYNHLKNHLTPETVEKVSKFSDGAHYDMDILNFVLDAGNRTRILSKYYALLDSYFYEDDSETFRRETELNKTFYMHFTVRKPLMYLETRPWPLDVDTSENGENSTLTRPTGRFGFRESVYYPFWKAFDRQCRVLVQKSPTVPPAPANSASSYPDDELIMKFINNRTDLIIAHL